MFAIFWCNICRAASGKRWKRLFALRTFWITHRSDLTSYSGRWRVYDLQTGCTWSLCTQGLCMYGNFPSEDFFASNTHFSNAEAQVKKLQDVCHPSRLEIVFPPIILSNMLGYHRIYYQILLSVRVKPYLRFNLSVLCSYILLQP